MKTKLIVLFLCIGFLAQAQSMPVDILKKVDAIASFYDTDFSAQYTLVQDNPGEGRKTTVAAVFRRDRNEIYSIVITAPDNNKGQGYLKQGNTLWFYDPESRRFNSTSSKERFQNSNARNSDFTRSTLAEDYDIKSSTKGKLGKYECWILELEANNDEVTYAKMKIWVSTDDMRVLKSEDYSLSGQLLRTTVIPAYQTVGNRIFPEKLLYVEHLEGAVIDGKFIPQRTQVTIGNVATKNLPDSVFSKTFLESVSK